MAMQPRMRVLLPVVWAMGCAVGFGNPGDEHVLFALGSMLGTWPLMVTSSNLGLMLPLLVGCALMGGAGRLLECLAASRALWLATWLVFGVSTCALSLAQFDSIEAAVAKNGSLGAYIAFASQLGTYAATIVTLLVAAVHRWLGVVANEWRATADV